MELYTVLPAIDAIRLLTLHPRQEGSEIRCTLQTTSLSSNPTYTALSYEWGEAKDPKTVILNGQQVCVRANLWRFLSRLCHAHDDRILWIDAICINQNDIAERNQQVQVMAQIYESASAVWIWLEEDTGTARTVFQFINSAAGLEAGSDAEGLDSSLDLWSNSQLNEAIVDLSKKTYFTRTWIVQEVLLARELIVHCGEHSIEWDAFLEKCWKVCSTESKLILLAQARNRRKEYAGHDGYGSLISDFGSSQCTDVRDKVYGLLGLLPEYKDRLQVDYAVTLPVLYFQTLSLFEESRKVLSAEHLRRYLGLAWPQLYSVPESPSQKPFPSASADSSTSIRVILQVAGPIREIEPRRQLFPHGPGHRHSKPGEPRRRYFTFRFSQTGGGRDNRTYGLSVCRPLPEDSVVTFLEVPGPALIFRKTAVGKLVVVGGAATSITLKACLSLLAETPDHARLAVLRKGLFSCVEVRERGGLLDAKITVQDLEAILSTSFAK